MHLLPLAPCEVQGSGNIAIFTLIFSSVVNHPRGPTLELKGGLSCCFSLRCCWCRGISARILVHRTRSFHPLHCVTFDMSTERELFFFLSRGGEIQDLRSLGDLKSKIYPSHYSQKKGPACEGNHQHTGSFISGE